jgi:hypothetical protein
MSPATVGTTKVKRGNTTMIEADENGSFDFCTTSKNPVPTRHFRQSVVFIFQFASRMALIEKMIKSTVLGYCIIQSCFLRFEMISPGTGGCVDDTEAEDNVVDRECAVKV